MHDTKGNKMEEGHDTIQAKKRAIHDDTQIWGKTDPTFGSIRPLSQFNPSPASVAYRQLRIRPCPTASVITLQGRKEVSLLGGTSHRSQHGHVCGVPARSAAGAVCQSAAEQRESRQICHLHLVCDCPSASSSCAPGFCALHLTAEPNASLR